MRQAETGLDKIFRNGLRQFSNNPRNMPALVECHNLAPAEQGLEPHEEILDLGASGVSWGGKGVYVPGGITRTVTIRVSDYVDDTELSGVSVYLDEVLQGTTDSDGEIDITGVQVGGHELRLTKTSYTDSDQDNLFNDYIMVI